MPTSEVNKKQIRFIVDIVDHCNLNCKGCGHFSPLASKSFLDLETFENDLRRLNELLDGEIYCFEIMGGEALLHPQLEKFIEITAKYSEFSYKLYLKFLCDRLGVGGAAYLGGDRLLA